MPNLSKQDILSLFNMLNDTLSTKNINGELYLVGGAVMCLVYNARASTNDIDGYFVPTQAIRQAATRIAKDKNLSPNWLNDGVKGYLSEQADFMDYLSLSHLRVYHAKPEYLLAMKCLAMRIGEEFHDVDDVRYLIRYLNLTDYQDVVSLITQYYPLEKFPQKTLYALEEILHVK